MTGKLFSNLQVEFQIEEGRKRTIESERQQINESILDLDLNSKVEKVSVYKALQILTKQVEGDSDKVERLSQDEIIKSYRSNLMILLEEIKKPKAIIKLELEKTAYNISNTFLDFIKEEDIFGKTELGEWLTFAVKYSDFYIPIINIKKLLIELKSNPNSYPQKSSHATKSRQELLIDTFNSLSAEDQALLFDTPQGKKGIKDKVRKSIPQSKFNLYFAGMDHNFDNAWKRVRKILMK